jgi:hypothetical protein
MFLFALPAGALADIIDKRRFILSLEIIVVGISVVFAALVTANLVSPQTLLLFIFFTGALAALEAPAWQAIVPRLVPKEDLSSAIARQQRWYQYQPRCGSRARRHHHRVLRNSRTVLARCRQQPWCDCRISVVAITGDAQTFSAGRKNHEGHPRWVSLRS